MSLKTRAALLGNGDYCDPQSMTDYPLFLRTTSTAQSEGHHDTKLICTPKGIVTLTVILLVVMDLADHLMPSKSAAQIASCSTRVGERLPALGHISQQPNLQ
jgi:hypothetical protein